MGKIYLNQSSLRIQLTTNVDITGATAQVIKYKKPDTDETEGEWTALIEADGDGIIYYDLTGTELDVAGTWTLWAFVTFSDARTAPGEPVKVTVHTEGE